MSRKLNDPEPVSLNTSGYICFLQTGAFIIIKIRKLISRNDFIQVNLANPLIANGPCPE